MQIVSTLYALTQRNTTFFSYYGEFLTSCSVFSTTSGGALSRSQVRSTAGTYTNGSTCCRSGLLGVLLRLTRWCQDKWTSNSGNLGNAVIAAYSTQQSIKSTLKFNPLISTPQEGRFSCGADHLIEVAHIEPLLLTR